MFWNARINMFDHDRSAARGEMASRKLIVFEHESELGNASAQKLFDLIEVTRKDNSEGPARNFSDHEITVGTMPDGVELIEKL